MTTTKTTPLVPTGIKPTDYAEALKWVQHFEETGNLHPDILSRALKEKPNNAYV